MKTIHPVRIIVFRVVTCDCDVFPSFIFSRDLTLNSKGWLLEDPKSGNRNQRHVIRAEEPSLGCKNISSSISPLTSGRLTPQIVILLIIMYGHGSARDQENSTQHQSCTKGKKNGNIYRFKQGDRRKGWQEIPKSSKGRE